MALPPDLDIRKLSTTFVTGTLQNEQSQIDAIHKQIETLQAQCVPHERNRDTCYTELVRRVRSGQEPYRILYQLEDTPEPQQPESTFTIGQRVRLKTPVTLGNMSAIGYVPKDVYVIYAISAKYAHVYNEGYNVAFSRMLLTEIETVDDTEASRPYTDAERRQLDADFARQIYADADAEDRAEEDAKDQRKGNWYGDANWHSHRAGEDTDDQA